MPQFEVVNFAPQFVWLLIAFTILYFGIVRPTLPKLARAIDARDGQVKGDIATAERAKAEADRMAVEYEAGVSAARDAARDRLGAAHSRAAASLEAKLATSNTAIAARTAEADRALTDARDRATSEIETVASDAAADIVERLTGTRPAGDEASAAARAALV